MNKDEHKAAVARIAGEMVNGAKLRGAAKRVFALHDFLKDHKFASFSERVRITESTRAEFGGIALPGLHWVDLGEREPSVSHGITRAGRVLEHRCEYSGHNGDSYGDRYRELNAEEALQVLLGLSSSLERRAMSAEERRLEEAAARRRTEAARKNLNARLKSKGLL